MDCKSSSIGFDALQKIVWSILVLTFLQSCHSAEDNIHFDDGHFRVWLEPTADSRSRIHLSVEGRETDCIDLPYPVFRLEGADLTGDGLPEICIGVENRTRYWKTVARRIHIYRLYHGKYIRPLWLGSRVGYPLQDFQVCNDSLPVQIHTRESAPSGETVQRAYILQGFGLRFLREIKAVN